MMRLKCFRTSVRTEGRQRGSTQTGRGIPAVGKTIKKRVTDYGSALVAVSTMVIGRTEWSTETACGFSGMGIGTPENGPKRGRTDLVFCRFTMVGNTVDNG